jgi:hypothetical protein
MLLQLHPALITSAAEGSASQAWAVPGSGGPRVCVSATGWTLARAVKYLFWAHRYADAVALSRIESNCIACPPRPTPTFHAPRPASRRAAPRHRRLRVQVALCAALVRAWLARVARALPLPALPTRPLARVYGGSLAPRDPSAASGGGFGDARLALTEGPELTQLLLPAACLPRPHAQLPGSDKARDGDGDGDGDGGFGQAMLRDSPVADPRPLTRKHAPAHTRR